MESPKITHIGHCTNDSPDARFEVLGAPSSLLSVTLSASQPLYTRRGTLAALTGNPSNALSTLSLLSPLLRSLTATPFLYQKLTSTTPLTALIAPRSPNTTFAVIYLDGRLDWVVAQRDGLAAWAGDALTVRPRLAVRSGGGVAGWGQSALTGRGLVALLGRGNVYTVVLKAGEEYVLQPSHVLAYTASAQHPPQPFRFKSRAFRLQVPALAGWVPFADSRFVREMRATGTWRFLAGAAFTLRMWARRTIWGDRPFLRFQGPATILMQSSGAGLREALSERDVSEVADRPAGAVERTVAREHVGAPEAVQVPASPPDRPTKVSFATVRSGKVEIRDTKV